MPYREKVAWLSLAAMAVAFGWYFTLTLMEAEPAGGRPDVALLVRFTVAVVIQVAILGAGHAYLRLSAPEDATEPADERDRAIERRSMTAAYYVLIVGAILAGVVMPFYETAWALVNATLATIVVAEMVHYGVVVRSYRRGWHD